MTLSQTTRDRHEPIGVGVIGVGRMGAQHAENLTGAVVGAKLVAIADPDEAAGRRVGDALAVQAVYTDYKQLLARDDVDAVVIAAPADTREEMIEACVAAGKHMLCEKPVAHDLPAARRVRRLLENAAVTYQLGFMRRFDPSYVHAYRLIRQGAIGKPVFIRLISRDAEGPPVEFVGGSGGLFVDSSVHDFDLARWLMGAEVERVLRAGRDVHLSGICRARRHRRGRGVAELHQRRHRSSRQRPPFGLRLRHSHGGAGHRRRHPDRIS